MDSEIKLLPLVKAAQSSQAEAEHQPRCLYSFGKARSIPMEGGLSAGMHPRERRVYVTVSVSRHPALKPSSRYKPF